MALIRAEPVALQSDDVVDRKKRWFAAGGIIGAILAGFMLGIAENLAAGFLDDIVGGGTKELVVASVILLTILIRPHGMFGREDIERI